MSDHIYVVYYKDDIIGTFNNKLILDKHITYAKQLNLITEDIKITRFRLNSLLGLENENIKKEPIKIDKKPEPIKHEENPEVLAEKEKIAKEKAEILHKINMLKHQKKLLEEEKTTFESDNNLYNMFKKEFETNKEFEIPELFRQKYEIFRRLEESNNLNFDNYKIEWDKVKPKNNYSMFSVNPYELQFETSKEIVENESFII
jgi:hypothetical protein